MSPTFRDAPVPSRPGRTAVLLVNLGTPDAATPAAVRRYLGEFLHNQFLPETRQGVLDVIDRMKRDRGIEAVILGGTELPILLRSESYNGLPLLDTTKIHAAAVLKAARAQ